MKRMKTSKQAKHGFTIDLPVSKSMIDSLMEDCVDAIIVTDQKGKINFWNKKAKTIFGFSRKEIVGQPIFTLISKEYLNKYQTIFNRFFNRKNTILKGELIELECLNKKGKLISVEMSLSTIKEGSKFLLFGLIRDISTRVGLQQKLYQQAITDSLTGAYNRRYFDEMLKNEFIRANRYKKPFSVIVIDVDALKQANDLYGHSFGDKVLIKATDVFREGIRTVDTVYRYGGDEFVIILPETEKESALEIAERLRSNFVKKCKVKNKRIKLSLSIGLASFPEDSSDEKGLIASADRRMYYSKGEGGNIVTAHRINEFFGTQNETFLHSLTSLTLLMEKRRNDLDPSYGIGKTHKKRDLTMEMGRRAGLSSAGISLLEIASQLHDIGMLFIPEVISKRGKLYRNEWIEIHKHPLIGEDILKSVLSSSDKKEVKNLPKIVGQHHEWVNGKGYPGKLKGNQILLEARILHVADAYEAMSSDRPYRKALKIKEIVGEFKKYSSKQFDPEIIKILFSIESLK